MDTPPRSRISIYERQNAFFEAFVWLNALDSFVTCVYLLNLSPSFPLYLLKTLFSFELQSPAFVLYYVLLVFDRLKIAIVYNLLSPIFLFFVCLKVLILPDWIFETVDLSSVDFLFLPLFVCVKHALFLFF